MHNRDSNCDKTLGPARPGGSAGQGRKEKKEEQSLNFMQSFSRGFLNCYHIIVQSLSSLLVLRIKVCTYSSDKDNFILTL